jgi:small subunit ribosomal protein S15
MALSFAEKTVFARVEDEPPLPPIADHGFLYGITEAELEAAGAPEVVRRALSTRTGSISAVRKFRTAELVARFGAGEADTGSSRVQIAVLSDSIARLSSHLSKNAHDTHAKRQLQILTSRRRKLLR